MATKRQRRKKRTLPSKAEIAVKFIQFSKKITTFVLIFWAVYRVAQLVVLVVRPDVGDTLVKMSSGVDTTAIIFGSLYTGNSISEKAFQMHKDVQKYVYLGNEKEDESEEEKDSDDGNG